MTELLEAWTDSEVNRAEIILSTLIGPNLDNNDNKMENLEFDNVEEHQASVLEKPKVDEFEEDQASDILKKKKIYKYDSSITSTKTIMTKLTKWRNQGKIWIRKTTHLLPTTKKKIDTETKTKKSQTSSETVVTSKNNKNDTVDKIDKSRSIPVTNISNKITQIENPGKMKMFMICIYKEKV